MTKELTENREYPMGWQQAKTKIVTQISSIKDMRVENCTEEPRGAIITAFAERSFYSNKGENITVIIENTGENKCLVTIRSALAAKLQVSDNGKNQKNIERIF